MDATQFEGAIHLVVEAGCGGTTFALQATRNHLNENGHVAWVCPEMPDRVRFSQLFAEVNPVAVSRLHLAASGDNIEKGIASARDLLNLLGNLTLVVIDDWCPVEGRPSSEVIEAMCGIIGHAREKEVAIIAVSAAYEDASGESEWKARGGSALEDAGARTWFLLSGYGGMSRRELRKEGGVVGLQLGDDGFSKR
jgi:hypothetical protein